MPVRRKCDRVTSRPTAPRPKPAARGPLPADGQAGALPVSSAQAIRLAAVRLFFEQGYAETTLRQVAQASGLKVSSLYNHMSSKEELLFEIMKGVMTDLIAVSEAALEQVTDQVERLDCFVRAGIRFHAEHQHAALIGNSEIRALSAAKRRAVVRLRDQYQTTFERLLQDAVEAGRIQVPDVKLAAYAGIAILNHVASWYEPDGRLSLDEVEAGLVATYAPISQRSH